MCLGISSSFFRVSHPKSTPSVLKKYLNDVFETYRSHDMVMHLCIFQFFLNFVALIGFEMISNRA